MEKSVVHRDSNIELFRIIVMLLIVAHHYVGNSGLMPMAVADFPSAKSMFILLFGWAGKTGIDCFVLITGYFMCRSNINLRKFIKLFGAFYFYKILFFAVFAITGYVELSPKFIVKSLMPILAVKDGFVACYLVFFLFIPFLNILIDGMSKRKHLLLLVLTLVVYSIFPQVLIKVSYNYVSWFMVVYLVGAYFRLYPPRWSQNKKITGFLMIFLVFLSLASVCVSTYMSVHLNKDIYYFFVHDSNKPLALATAVCAFLFFLNLKMGYSKVVNTIAASAFGVLLIHANSDTMRQWLWRDTLDNVGHYAGNIVLHAIVCVIVVYCVCTIIDYIRIRLLEKPFFKWFDNKYSKEHTSSNLEKL